MKDNLIRGKIAAERTGVGIPDLLVVVADRDPHLLEESETTDPSVGDSWRFDGIWADLTKSGDRIGSVLTDEQGRFELEYDDSEYRGGDQEYRPDLWFIVLAPEKTQELEEVPTEPSGEIEEESSEPLTHAFAVPPEEQIVHVSYVPRVEAGRMESYILYLTDEQIEQAGIAFGGGAFVEPEAFDPTKAADEYLATVANDLNFRTRVKAGLVEIEGRQETVNRQREYYEEIRSQTQVLTAAPATLAQGAYFVPEFAESSVFRDKKTEVRGQGLGRIENYRAEIEDSDPWVLVLTDDVFVNLGIAIPDQAPTTEIITDEAFCSLMRRPSEGYDLTRVRGLLEQEFSEEGDGVGGSGEPTETEEGEQQEGIDVEAEIRRRVLEEVSDGTIADGAESGDGDRETQRRNTLSQIAANDGPADITSIHDFHSLQIAFRHVWTEAFDPSVKRLIEDVYNTHLRLHEDYGVQQSLDIELNEVGDVYRFLEDVERASDITKTDVPPEISSTWPQATYEVWNALSEDEREHLMVLSEQIQTARGSYYQHPDTRVLVEVGTRGASLLSKAEKRVTDPIGSKNASGARTRLQRLLLELRDRLSTPYAFHYFHPGDEQTGPAVNYGLLTTYRQEWTPIQYQVGDLVSTIPLAPGETRKYETKEVLKRSRATKEVENALSARRGESTQTRRAEAEIVDKASLNTNFKMSASGGFGSFFQASSEFALNQARESARTKKDFREAVLKASHEYKQERTLEISTTDELTAETTSSGELSNPNNELTVTYLLYELERLYQISERIHQLTPVVLVPQEVPAPHEITESWLLEHEWILRRVLLDDSLQFALDYLTESFAGDELSLEIKEAHWKMRRDLLIELEATVEERRTVRDSLRNLYDLLSVGFRGRDMAEVIDIVEDNSEALSDLGGEFAEISDLLEERVADFDAIPRKRLRKDIERLLERREAMVEEAQQQLSSAAEALDAAMAGYATALEDRTNQRVAIDTLRMHVRQNILYYMQAIWEHEPPDQRYLRLYHRDVYVPRVGDVNVTIRRAEDDDVSDLFGLQRFMTYNGERYVVETQSLPIEAMASEEGNTAQLVEIADLDNPLGYWGNCVVFPLQTCTFVTDYMMREYVDSFLGIHDPDPLSEFTSEQIREFVERKRTEFEENEELSQEEKELELSNLEEALSEVIQQRLSNPRRETDVVVVPTGQLYMEALLGDEALLEEFKLIHRGYDMEKARAELRQEELENLRYAARLLEAEPDLDDPDADRYVVVEGIDSGVVVSVDESDGDGSDGESG